MSKRPKTQKEIDDEAALARFTEEAHASPYGKRWEREEKARVNAIARNAEDAARSAAEARQFEPGDTVTFAFYLQPPVGMSAAGWTRIVAVARVREATYGSVAGSLSVDVFDPKDLPKEERRRWVSAHRATLVRKAEGATHETAAA